MKPALAVPAVMAAILTVALAAEWMPVGDAPPVLVPPPSLHARGAAGEPDSVAKDTESWARTIDARPLFNMNRRPAKTVDGKTVVASTGLPRLSGIMISSAGRRAIFSPEGGKAQTLAEGASLDDYTIRKISADRVVLSGAKGEMVLKPAYDGSRAAGETGQPGFQPPAFQTPGIAQPIFNPGFRPPGFQPGQPSPAAPVANAADDDSDDASPTPQPVAPQPFPGFRGPFIPRGRNNE